MQTIDRPQIAIIGGGPSGLMAAETIANAGLAVTLFDAMPSVGRKFLLAGKGGLNLTHAEALDDFLGRYGSHRPQLEPLIRDLDPEALRAWASDLGVETFIGTSKRVFPTEMKAAPLLRAWVRRLKERGVQFQTRHRWIGWDNEDRLLFSTPQGQRHVTPTATILALGGASWPRLGSDGAWTEWLKAREIPVSPLEASNVGFMRHWSEIFIRRFAGIPVKTIEARLASNLSALPIRGELMITERGLEGGLLYALSGELRAAIQTEHFAELRIDLAPDRPLERLKRDLLEKRGKDSLTTHLKKKAGLSDVKIGLLRECAPQLDFQQLPEIIKALPVRVENPFPITEAISSAGGVDFESLDDFLMVKRHPGLFIAGEMLNWDAPTGGYLLTAAFATGRRVGLGAIQWIQTQTP